MQLRSLFATAAIYRSGKVIVMGSRSEKEAGMVAVEFTRIIAKALNRDLQIERL
jgi:TATA-box binding protein (TBP) (component of TFIID and TFIIIB)